MTLLAGRLRHLLPRLSFVALVALLIALLAVVAGRLDRLEGNVVETLADALERAARAEAELNASRSSSPPAPPTVEAPAVERIVEAVRESGLPAELIDRAVEEAARRLRAQPGPAGPRGAPGPPGTSSAASSTTTTRAPPTTATTAGPPAPTTTTSTAPGRADERPCAVRALGVGLLCP